MANCDNPDPWWGRKAVIQQNETIAKMRVQAKANVAADLNDAKRRQVSPLGGEMQGRFRGISRAVSLMHTYIPNVKQDIEAEARRGFDPNRFRTLVAARRK